MNPSVNVVVLNYNGRELAERFLPSVIASTKKSRFDCTVTVLDNDGKDGVAEYVAKNFPSVCVVRAPENKVLCSYNDFARQASEDILVLLNNDIGPSENFIDPLIEPFLKDPQVFFTASYGDCSIPVRRWGVWGADIGYPGYRERLETPGAAFSAGVGAFDRLKFLELDGYDELYLPGRYEDVDLCYRGWKRGWRGVYAPLARKEHVGGATFEKVFDERATQTMVFRNSLLFMMKNITDPMMRAQFYAGTFFRLFVSLLSGRWHYWKGFLQALERRPQALKSRKEVTKQFKRSDREVLREVGMKNG